MEKATFKPSDAMIRAAELVFTAKAMCETTREIVVDYQRKILNEGQWPLRAQFRNMEGLGSLANIEVILNPRDVFLLEDVDLATYLARCNEERIKARLTVSVEGNDPLLEAEYRLSEAQFHLIDLMAPHTGISEDDARGTSPEVIGEIVDLTLRLLAPYVRSAAVLLEELRSGAERQQLGETPVINVRAPTVDCGASTGKEG